MRTADSSASRLHRRTTLFSLGENFFERAKHSCVARPRGEAGVRGSRARGSALISTAPEKKALPLHRRRNSHLRTTEIRGSRFRWSFLFRGRRLATVRPTLADNRLVKWTIGVARPSAAAQRPAGPLQSQQGSMVLIRLASAVTVTHLTSCDCTAANPRAMLIKFYLKISYYLFSSSDVTLHSCTSRGCFH